MFTVINFMSQSVYIYAILVFDFHATDNHLLLSFNLSFIISIFCKLGESFSFIFQNITLRMVLNRHNKNKNLVGYRDTIVCNSM